MKQATRTDPQLSWVYRYTQVGRPEHVPTDLKSYYDRRGELTVEAGCVLWGIRVLILEKLRSLVLEMVHEGHLGIVRMKSLARSYLWWPGLDGDLEKLGKACVQCQKEHKLPAAAPFTPMAMAIQTWARVHLTLLAPFREGWAWWLSMHIQGGRKLWKCPPPWLLRQ